MAKQPGSRRYNKQKEAQADLIKDVGPRQGYTNSSSVAGSQNIFEALFNSVFDNKNALYNTAEKTALINSCIMKIAKDVSKASLYLTKRVDNETYIPFKSSKRYKHKLSKPNQYDTEYTFKMKLMFGLLIEGKIAIVKSKGKTQDNYNVFQSRYISAEIGKDGQLYYQISINGKQVDIAQENLCWVVLPGFGRNGEQEYSYVKASLQEVLLYKNSLDHENQFISKGMMSRGFLQLAPETTYTFEQRQAISQEFSNRTSGQNSTSTLALPPGITYSPVQSTNQEGMILELLGFAKDMVLNTFGIPKSIFDQEFASYATADVQLNEYYNNTIEPIYKLIEDAINNCDFLTSEQEWFKFDRSFIKSAEKEKAFAQADLAKAQAAQVKKSLYNVSINEVRTTAGLDPILDDNGKPDPIAEDIPMDSQDLTTIFSPATSQDTTPAQKNFYKKAILGE